MTGKPLFWRVFLFLFALVSIPAILMSWLGIKDRRHMAEWSTRRELERAGRLVLARLPDSAAANAVAEIRRECRGVAEATRIRLTVLTAEGGVLADSLLEPAEFRNQVNAPLVRQVLETREAAFDCGFAPAGRQWTGTVVLPWTHENRLLGLIRAASPVAPFRPGPGASWQRLFLVLLAMGGLCALVALRVSRHVSAGIAEIVRGTERFGRGDFSSSILCTDPDELVRCADALNHMAAQLAERFVSIERQRNEQEAILSSIVEGVVAVDADERVISINEAAGRMLEVDPEEARGLSLQMAVRNVALHELVAEAFASRTPVERDIQLGHRVERYLQANGTGLRNAENRLMGVVVVLNDVTRLRRLESLRRDFAANVSHELKTPITSIKGFVETLLDGAVKETTDAERFLNIILKQADRLSAIIEDLLLLSRVEREGEASAVQLESCLVLPHLEAATNSLQNEAEDRDVTIEVRCPGALSARLNPLLFEQAVMNLIKNAVSYSNPGSRVVVEVSQTERQSLVHVRDAGCGIAPEHLERLFERFYRVDRARSREKGGTGLGLAIVKHIANAHEGTVSVQSTLGKGSIFTIHLPRNE